MFKEKWVKIVLGTSLVLLLICSALAIYLNISIQETEDSTEDIAVLYEDYTYNQNVTQYSLAATGYPTGNELASATILLRAYGFEVTMKDLLAYADFSDEDWTFTYYGSIDNTAYAYQFTIADIVEKYIREEDSDFVAYGTSNTFDSLIEETLNNGIPAIIWVTDDWSLPEWQYSDTDNSFAMYDNETTIVIYDIDDYYIYYSSPITGYGQIEIDTCATMYEACGCHTVYIK